MDPKKNVKISPYPNKIKDGTPSLGASYAASVVLPKKKKKKMELARRVLSPTMNVTTQLISKN